MRSNTQESEYPKGAAVIENPQPKLPEPFEVTTPDGAVTFLVRLSRFGTKVVAEFDVLKGTPKEEHRKYAENLVIDRICEVTGTPREEAALFSDRLTCGGSRSNEEIHAAMRLLLEESGNLEDNGDGTSAVFGATLFALQWALGSDDNPLALLLSQFQERKARRESRMKARMN